MARLACERVLRIGQTFRRTPKRPNNSKFSERIERFGVVRTVPTSRGSPPNRPNISELSEWVKRRPGGRLACGGRVGHAPWRGGRGPPCACGGGRAPAAAHVPPTHPGFYFLCAFTHEPVQQDGGRACASSAVAGAGPIGRGVAAGRMPPGVGPGRIRVRPCRTRPGSHMGVWRRAKAAPPGVRGLGWSRPRALRRRALGAGPWAWTAARDLFAGARSALVADRFVSAKRSDLLYAVLEIALNARVAFSARHSVSGCIWQHSNSSTRD